MQRFLFHFFSFFCLSIWGCWCKTIAVDRETVDIYWTSKSFLYHQRQPQLFVVFPLNLFLLCSKYRHFSYHCTLSVQIINQSRNHELIRIKLRIQHFGNTFKPLMTESLIFLSVEPLFSSFLHCLHGKRKHQRKERISLGNLVTNEQNQIGWQSPFTKKEKIKQCKFQSKINEEVRKKGKKIKDQCRLREGIIAIKNMEQRHSKPANNEENDEIDKVNESK